MSKCSPPYLILFLVVVLAFSLTSYGEYQSSQITSQEIISHIRYLAADELEGRKAGTEGCEKAANYISSHFQRAGLKPLGGSATYFQNFSFTSGIKFGSPNSLTLEQRSRRLDLEVGKDFFPLSFSSNGEVSGELVFAGYGISAPNLNYDDYSRINAKDKIVIVLRYTPEGNDPKSLFYNYASLRYKATNARGKGAKGIIFITPFSHDEEEDLGGLRVDLSFKDSGIQTVILRRKIAEEILGLVGKDIKDLERELSNKKVNSFVIPDVKVQIHTELIHEGSATSNVIGFLEGSNPTLKDEVIIIGAHYDHIGLWDGYSRGRSETREGKVHNGADDNASGVAGLLELADYFSSHKKSLQRSLLFIAFSGEELGLLGSSYYVKNPEIPLDKTIAMINMDMIGRLRNQKLTVLGTGSSPEWKTLIESVNYNTGLTLKISDSGFAPSDQVVFYAKEIPVLQFFTGVHPDYHTPDDDWQKINLEGERKILKLISNIVWDLTKSPEKIAFSRAREEEKTASSFNVYLGTIPDYSDESDGVKLIGVKEGSPAQKAGLRSGDNIVGFDGKTITNIYDYVYSLAESKPGVSAEIVVIRGTKPVKFNIVPESRREKN
ncbi:MAG: M28 family peptidase [Deltaproteobacteria bacterium]|nr:M28 family peptidase [Deltaproteobacteria bacterium]